MAEKRYDSILYDYFEKQGGVIILLSEDLLFKKILSNTIFKTIGTKRDCLWAYEGIQAGLKKIQQCQKNKIECTVFIERMIADRPSTDTIITLKQLLPDLRIIVLVGETKRENIAYFYEIGVNNVISKPASVNNIIEKMAFTLKPQGKLSEYMSIGKRFLTAGKLKEALEVSDKILSLKPDSPAGLMLRGDVYLTGKDHTKAVASYLKAHESSRLYLEPLKRLANAYDGVDDDQHLYYLKKLDKLSPLNTERKTGIGKVYIKRKELDVAEEYFDKALETATKEAMSLVGSVAEQITEAVGQSSPRMAEKYLSKVLESKGNQLSKKDISLFNKLGIALRGQGKWREAIENYTRALTISPEDEGLHYNMGMAYFDGKEHRMAAACFEKALENNPDFYKQSEVVSMNLGTVYMDLRRLDRALVFFEAAYALNPSNRMAKRKIETLQKSSA
ncbi:tetratricopeptide repeat protein [Pseudodesulfovibrio piezophilus]|uniref:TPR repeat-containing protein n=1 Tax=Pseudodesulfovibrio piezophilus (strain DSM 21447 / JCM 15486 / C1TLV30) TaxID=1322246 RepID=M1WRU2_PSEP2|nr:tetratricopeptide repeat protein [Pseudodesulfovibrio piezophilus]CCH49769.1 TPR repeat-containing protein [Pseudodesulfovibrio piezophilus C1TLV30]